MDPSSAIVLAVIRAVEERDRDSLLALSHDEVEFVDAESLPYGGASRGKEQLREQLESPSGATWMGTWGPLQPTPAERRMDPRVVASNGGEVTVVYRQRALSTTGERLDAPVLGLYEVRDGRFARAQMFHFDTAAIVAFLRRAGSGAGGEPE